MLDFERMGAKIALYLVTVFFLSGRFLGLFHATLMPDMTGDIGVHCPFMPGETALCTMNPLQHIAAWQNAFASIASQDAATLLLLLLGALILARIWTRVQCRPSALLSERSKFAYQKYTPLSSPLQEAFSNGIIHSRAF